MRLSFHVDALNTSRHLMYFGIGPVNTALWNFYEEWLASRILSYNEAGNMKTASCHLIVTHGLNLTKNLLLDHCLKTMCVNLENDGSKDNIVQF